MMYPIVFCIRRLSTRFLGSAQVLSRFRLVSVNLWTSSTKSATSRPTLRSTMDFIQILFRCGIWPRIIAAARSSFSACRESVSACLSIYEERLVLQINFITLKLTSNSSLSPYSIGEELLTIIGSSESPS